MAKERFFKFSPKGFPYVWFISIREKDVQCYEYFFRSKMDAETFRRQWSEGADKRPVRLTCKTQKFMGKLMNVAASATSGFQNLVFYDEETIAREWQCDEKKKAKNAKRGKPKGPAADRERELARLAKEKRAMEKAANREKVEESV